MDTFFNKMSTLQLLIFTVLAFCTCPLSSLPNPQEIADELGEITEYLQDENESDNEEVEVSEIPIESSVAEVLSVNVSDFPDCSRFTPCQEEVEHEEEDGLSDDLVELEVEDEDG